MKNFIQNLKRKLAENKKNKVLDFIKNRGTTYSSSTNKTVISPTETLVLSTKAKKLIECVKNEVEEINRTANNNPEALISYIKDASKRLEKIKEHTGFLCALEGGKAMYINTILGLGISPKTAPMFIIDEDKKTDYYMLLREFYLWYSMDKGLDGFNYSTQELFKKYLEAQNWDMGVLKYDEMCALKEAIARDSEANEFVMEMFNRNEGAKNIKQGGNAEI